MIPQGFRIERHDRRSHTEFAVYEDGGPTWEDGSPRPVIDVELWPADDELGFRSEPQISWPSTSDKRPALALALAAALVMAAEESQR